MTDNNCPVARKKEFHCPWFEKEKQIITALRAEVELLEHRRRWNVEERLNGRIGVCRQMHEKHEPCEYEEYAPVAEVERLREALEEAQNDAIDRRRLSKRLAARYNDNPQRIAEMCDGAIDPSGRLLGYVREEARAALEERT